MRRTIFVLFLFCSACSYAQIWEEGTVKDADTKKPLPFCTIAIKGSDKGIIANQDGRFKISVAYGDSLVISFIGYKTKTMYGLWPGQAVILLQPNAQQMKAAIVHADDDYLYEIMDQCRNAIRKIPERRSKVYYQLETQIQNKPVEMLECYYNSLFNGAGIDSLQLKNGRIGLSEMDDHGFFVSLNTSKAIRLLNLAKQNDYLPAVPFQFKKSKLKKKYILEWVAENGDENMYHIRFTPRDTGSGFGGEAWIDKGTYALLKINLQVNKAKVYPFAPVFQTHSLRDVSMNISETFTIQDSTSLLNHVNFSYQLIYSDSGGNGRLHPSAPARQINTSCVLYFYDYDKPFILPYFNYAPDLSDYRKISSIPFNESFWNNSRGLMFTDEQKEMLAFFRIKGLTVNFDGHFNFPNHHGFFGDKNVFWSDTGRVSLKNQVLDSLLRNPQVGEGPGVRAVRSEMYKLNVQLFLDVNPVGDSLQHISATVFDVFQSYYNLPLQPYTDCFVNIYFDICEIERRRMEQNFATHKYDLAGMTSVYRQTLKEMDAQTTLYLKDVQTGTNLSALQKWNKYVYENLNIDNIKLFGL